VVSRHFFNFYKLIVNSVDIDCSNRLKKDLFYFLDGKFKEISEKNRIKLMDRALSISSEVKEINDTEKKILEIMDYIKSNFNPSLLKFTNKELPWSSDSRPDDKYDKKYDKTYSYKDSVVDISLNRIGTEYVCKYVFKLNNEVIPISHNFSSNIHSNFRYLHQTVENLNLSSKIDSTLKDIREHLKVSTSSAKKTTQEKI